MADGQRFQELKKIAKPVETRDSLNTKDVIKGEYLFD
jgi:hypothetical protein